MGFPLRETTEPALQAALAAAEASERRMRIAQRAAHAGTWEWDLRTGEVIRSPELEEIYGCAPGASQASLDWWRAHLTQDEAKRLDQQVERTLAERSDYHAEYRITRDDGASRWIEAFGKLFFDEAGNPARMVGVDFDITERKNVEEALRASREELRQVKERFELALQNSPITVFTQDGDLRYKWVYNPRGPDSVDYLIGKRDSEILERADEAAWMEQVKSEVLRTGVGFRGEMTAHFQGEPRTYHVSIEPTRDANCQIVGLTCACFELTEQKRSEAELQRLARQRQVALDAAQLGWWCYDAATGMSTWDEGCRKIFGIQDCSGPVEKVIGLILPEDQATAWKNFDEVMRSTTAQPRAYEYRIRRTDGSLRWIEAYGFAEFEGEGEQRRVSAIVATVRDITERKLAEEALRQQRERFDFVAEGSDVGFWFCDLPFDKLIWDKRVKNHFWFSEDTEPITITDFYARLHPDDREPTRLAIEKSIGDRTQYDTEYRTVLPDGRQKWIRAVGRGFYDEAGNPIRFDGITQDITERKCTEEALRASETRYRLLFETMAEGFALCELVRDQQGNAADIRWLACNPALERLTGLTRDQVVGHCASEIFPHEYKWWVEKYDLVVREKNVHRFERGADSVGRVWDLTAFPYEGDRFAVLYDDISARKQAEFALRASEARYRELAENLDRQVQARTVELQQRNEEVLRAADDLRELSGRVLRIQDEERRRIARDLHDSAGQILTALGLELGSLTGELNKVAPGLAMNLAAAEELVQQLHREIRTTSYLLHPPLLDEAGLSSALNWYVEGLSERSGIEVRLEIADDVGRLPRDLELVIFRLVQESMTNIHRHSGSRTAEIRVARESAAIVIEVQDYGSGMTPETLKKISEGGSGVGIRGMRERLRQFGGNLQIKSDEKGTRVLVRIPVRQSAGAELSGESLQPAV